eukprot:TRINITY_DN6724_c0_g1_i1.p1 TRINITY_DN6724_c0_g1~~TRINITY_DN6724_c0_g1_i1.p1  ORF type:complete len:102 (-),score=15.06 TRINITY_DN6724_c0_g1_i1:11-316(-)
MTVEFENSEGIKQVYPNVNPTLHPRLEERLQESGNHGQHGHYNTHLTLDKVLTDPSFKVKSFHTNEVGGVTVEFENSVTLEKKVFPNVNPNLHPELKNKIH